MDYQINILIFVLLIILLVLITYGKKVQSPKYFQNYTHHYTPFQTIYPLNLLLILLYLLSNIILMLLNLIKSKNGAIHNQVQHNLIIRNNNYNLL